MKENKMYEATVRMVGELHCLERTFWHQDWIEGLTPDDAIKVHDALKAAHYNVSQLRNCINHYTLAGEPEELELEDDGESHLRGMEAFAVGGMDAYNEAQGYGVVTDPQDAAADAYSRYNSWSDED